MIDYTSKVQELHKRIGDASSVLIVAHDYPDPDCLGAAFGMQHLLSHWGIENTQISFGGFIGRAENRAMIRYLKIQTVPINLIDIDEFERIIVVDSFPGDGNVSLRPEHSVDAVIDHHPHRNVEDKDFFNDIRNDLGSTSTIVAQYLIAAKCPIPTFVATALFYGIRTDTNHLSRNVSADDLATYKQLFDMIDHYILAHIVSPVRDAEYFRVLNRAAQAMLVYNTTFGFTQLGQISSPDYVPEIADLFHSLEDLEWMVCCAIFGNHIFFSIRSRNNDSAGKKAEKIALSLQGSGGGHTTMAAGRIPLIENRSIELQMCSFIDTVKTVYEIRSITGQAILKEKDTYTV